MSFKLISVASLLLLCGCLVGCSGEGENEVVVPDAEVTYSGDYAEDSPQPTY